MISGKIENKKEETFNTKQLQNFTGKLTMCWYFQHQTVAEFHRKIDSVLVFFHTEVMAVAINSSY